MGLIVPAIVIYNVAKAFQSVDIEEKAEGKLQKAYSLSAEKADQVRKHSEMANTSLKKVMIRKKALLSTHMKRFLCFYRQIQKIDFFPGDGIRELLSTSFCTSEIAQIETMASTSLQPLTQTQQVVTYLMTGLGNALCKDAEQNLKVAESQLHIARLYSGQADLAIAALNAVTERAEQFSALLAQFGMLLWNTLGAAEEIFARNGAQRENYSEGDIKVFFTCVNLAKAVKAMLDAPLLNEKGSLTETSLQVIADGNAKLVALKQK